MIMASTLVFDMADPGIKTLVDGWADNTEYTATVVVRTGTAPQRNVSEVVSFEPMETEAEEEPAEEIPAKPAPKAKPEVSVKY